MIDSFVRIENKEFQFNRRQSFSASLFILDVPTAITDSFYSYSGIEKTPVNSISGNKAIINFNGSEFSLLTTENRLTWYFSKDLPYETGTITGTAGTTTITGTLTEFEANVYKNDFLKVGNYYYEISSIDSDTQLTLKTALLETLTDSTFEIYTNIISFDQKINIFRSANSKLITRKDIVGLKPYIGKYQIFMGIIEDATTTTITDKALKTFELIDNIIGMNVRLVSGYGNCQESQITGYDPSTQTITFDGMVKSPSAEENYIILNNYNFQIEQAIIDIDLELRNRGLKINLIADFNYLRNLQLFRTLYYIADNYEGEEWLARKHDFNKQYNDLLNSFQPKVDMDQDGETDTNADLRFPNAIFSRGHNPYGMRRF